MIRQNLRHHGVPAACLVLALLLGGCSMATPLPQPLLRATFTTGPSPSVSSEPPPAQSPTPAPSPTPANPTAELATASPAADKVDLAEITQPDAEGRRSVQLLVATLRERCLL
jgi:hypothetical protein